VVWGDMGLRMGMALGKGISVVSSWGQVLMSFSEA